jgi:hypothetical protein
VRGSRAARTDSPRERACQAVESKTVRDPNCTLLLLFGLQFRPRERGVPAVHRTFLGQELVQDTSGVPVMAKLASQHQIGQRATHRANQRVCVAVSRDALAGSVRDESRSRDRGTPRGAGRRGKRPRWRGRVRRLELGVPRLVCSGRIGCRCTRGKKCDLSPAPSGASRRASRRRGSLHAA